MMLTRYGVATCSSHPWYRLLFAVLWCRDYDHHDYPHDYDYDHARHDKNDHPPEARGSPYRLETGSLRNSRDLRVPGDGRHGHYQSAVDSGLAVDAP